MSTWRGTIGKKLITDRGTPCAEAWDADWITLVERVESELDRRICGAVGIDGSPCPRKSDHPTGRCTHHGGNHLVGGQPGNENARLHGLYSRRLQKCDKRCALWEECPFAADDLLEIPLKQRPICVYEQLEYDALVAQYVPEENGDCTKRSESSSGDGTVPAFRDTHWKKSQKISAKPHLHLVHTVALLQVMMSRAAAVVSTERFTEKTSASGENYSMESTKVSASLDAFLRLAREHRHYHRELTHTVDLMPEPKPQSQPEPKPQGLADIMKPILEETDGILEGAIEFQRKLDARNKRKAARAAEREKAAEECRRDACLTEDATEGGRATTDPEGRATLPRGRGHIPNVASPHVPTWPPRKTVEVELDPTGDKKTVEEEPDLPGETDETMDKPPPPDDPNDENKPPGRTGSGEDASSSSQRQARPSRADGSGTSVGRSRPSVCGVWTSPENMR